jgi:hypothetical protein
MILELGFWGIMGWALDILGLVLEACCTVGLWSLSSYHEVC